METILIGTYTRKTSEGIYQITLDKEKGVFKDLKLIAKTENPTYLEYDQDSKNLYAVYQSGERGGVAIWHYDEENTTLLESITQEGVQPCYVHYDALRDEIVDANYHTGQVNIYKNNKILETIQFEEGAHAHYAHTHPKTGDLYTVDLGNDVVKKFRNHAEFDAYHTNKGTGPRHLVFHPSAPIIYVFTEHSNDLIVLKDEDKFEAVQIINALPEGGENSGAAIRISSDGRFIYVSNRGHDSLTVFEVNDDYTVTLIQNISAYGKHPRDFNLNLDETYLIVGNRDTNNLTLYKRDTDTGKLTYLHADTHVPEPVSILPIKA